MSEFLNSIVNINTYSLLHFLVIITFIFIMISIICQVFLKKYYYILVISVCSTLLFSVITFSTGLYYMIFDLSSELSIMIYVSLVLIFINMIINALNMNWVLDKYKKV
ncbi:MAG: hypothetical protein L3J07_01900 [Candidatus Magasanikbacteria bacterium]|nr:hypothetical protein [Candidatus Magasanikbacteria bacterium]